MKLKPLPKMILIAAFVSVVGYVANMVLKNRESESTQTAVPSAPAPEVTVVTPPDPKAVPVAPAPAADSTPAPGLTPATTNDAGLANVLGK